MSTHVTTTSTTFFLTFFHPLLPLTKFQKFGLLRFPCINPRPCSVNIRHMSFMLLDGLRKWRCAEAYSDALSFEADLTS